MLKLRPRRRRSSSLAHTASEGIGKLRDQDHVGAARHAGGERDVPGVAPHDLEHHDPAVAGRGDVQAVDRLGRHLDGGAEADRPLGVAEIVVDGLGNADQAPIAQLGQAAQGREAAVAADADQRIELQGVIAGCDLGRTVDHAGWTRIGERVAAIGRAQQGAAHGQDAGDDVRAQRDRIDRPRQQPVGGLADAEHFPAVAEHGALDHGPDHCIQAGAVATAGQQAETQPASPCGPAAMPLHIGG